MAAPALMVQGTTSDAGKSTLVAGLGRVLARRGVRVAPFKPQNMALNSAVTVNGGEIGRAQAVQAMACRVPPPHRYEPGVAETQFRHRSPGHNSRPRHRRYGGGPLSRLQGLHHDYKAFAMAAVMESFRRLSKAYEAVLVEGAGSPAEINLRKGDIANMGFAEAADCPVILIADIDKGGVFAHLVGTLDLLSQSEQDRVGGFVINKFRGDLALLKPGLDWLENRTEKPVLGVLPYLRDLYLEAEDALPRAREDRGKGGFRVVVPALPHISNHTDFDPLRINDRIDFTFAAPGDTPIPADLIILPGSKSVLRDLEWLRASGWDAAITRHLRFGGKVIGICGGLQMLGHSIHDPGGIEGPRGSADGLGWLGLSTTLARQKRLENVSGTLTLGGALVTGYEIHAGESSGPALSHPAAQVNGCADGAISEDGQILATYLHGVFESAPAADALLRWAGLAEPRSSDHAAIREAGIDGLADAIETHLDLDRIFEILNLA